MYGDGYRRGRHGRHAQDDAAQSFQASQIIEHRVAEELPGFISLVTMIQTVSVLDRVYRLANQEIAAAVERILQAGTVQVRRGATLACV